MVTPEQSGLIRVNVIKIKFPFLHCPPSLSANRAHYYCYLGRKQVGESCSMFRHVSVLSDCFRNVSSTSFHRTTFHSIESNSPFPHFLKEDAGKEKMFLFTYIHSLSIVVRFNLLRCFLSKQPVVISKTLALVHVITIKFHLPRYLCKDFCQFFGGFWLSCASNK